MTGARMNCTSVELTRHAHERMRERRIAPRAVHRIVRTGEVIKEYPADDPLPCYIVFGHAGQRPIHVLVAMDPESKRCLVVTVYEPDPALWEADLKTRKPP